MFAFYNIKDEDVQIKKGDCNRTSNLPKIYGGR